MSCSKGETVFVYDSLSNVLSSLMERQLSLVYKTKDNNPIKVIVKCSQNQVGGRDCGLFAIANAAAVAMGVDPATIWFYQKKMRQHLEQCLQNKVLTMFPHKKKAASL